MQTQRFELKYILDELTARGVRDFVFPYLEMDPFGAKQPDFSYPVHSLYFDSPDLKLHHSTINGERNRFKLRIRFYEQADDAPVYFEIKRRENNAIYKQRCLVKREAVQEIMAGRIPTTDDLVHQDAENERALLNFCRQVSVLQAKPITHVSYRREAWHGHGDNRIRLTFDREVMTRPEPDGRLDPSLKGGIPVFGKNVILELKFTGRFPDWMSELVRVFNLNQSSAAKYVDGILGMEERRILKANTHNLKPLRLLQRRQRQPHMRTGTGGI
ncbi:MAG: polyphosphate polymerase domain-containing protein [Puniceicoccaceae bacterium]|nr:MAG: polyphosphate polymerase domain-containing protein [Puniceicoccaceae bacterium]